jgi:hypothetical protein
MENTTNTTATSIPGDSPLNRAYLATFIREMKHYHTAWGMAPDRQTILDAIRKAQRERAQTTERADILRRSILGGTS